MNNSKTSPYTQAAILVMALLAMPALAAETAQVLASSGFQSERAADGRHQDMQIFDVVPRHEDKTDVAQTGKQSTQPAQTTYCCSHYIYDGYAELYDDLDYDGFYTYLRINIDIDTDHYESDIYIKAFLRNGVGAWNRIYTSNTFTIYGSSAFDDYEIETELVSGFPADYYELLVEVYDAYSGELLVEYGAIENASFSGLPLEDVNRDGAVTLPIVTSYGTSGGGSVSLLALAGILGLVLRRRVSRSATTGI
ncbi:MAG: hypothetical protein HKN49_03625 [Gammaproteobacteria bacterium]|nr:hypothetical protein [Gammaproteobacteria bacterium]